MGPRRRRRAPSTCARRTASAPSASIPTRTPEEALAYFERKFTELAGPGRPARAARPRRRTRRGRREGRHPPRRDGRDGQRRRRPRRLSERLEKLGGSVGELTEKQQAEAKAAAAEALVQREALVAEAEALAAQDPAKAQWKQVTAQLDALFARWQRSRRTAPACPRTRATSSGSGSAPPARRSSSTARRSSPSSTACTKTRATASRSWSSGPRRSSDKGTDGIPDYRRLLDEWKLAGRAGKKLDDALWERFKAAGDILYAAKAEVDAKENEEFAGNLTEKLALLDEAEKLLTETDREKAKSALLGIQRKWDAIGKVPRDSIRTVEDRLRKVETHVRKLDEDHWNKSDPEKVGALRGHRLAAHERDREARDASSPRPRRRATRARSRTPRRPSRPAASGWTRSAPSSTRTLAQLFLCN